MVKGQEKENALSVSPLIFLEIDNVCRVIFLHLNKQYISTLKIEVLAE